MAVIFADNQPVLATGSAGGSSNGTSKYTTSFTNSSLSGNNLTVTHSLNSTYVHVTIYNNSNVKTEPTSITLVNANSLTISFSGMTPLTGTWNLIIVG